MRFHVDNTAVVRGVTTQNHRGPRATLAPEWDLMKQIRILKQQIPPTQIQILPTQVTFCLSSLLSYEFQLGFYAEKFQPPCRSSIINANQGYGKQK
jgi:hypothetical protein